MKIIYGRTGEAAGSIDGSDVYNRDGDQIGFLEGEYLYASENGDWIGSIVSGVVYNAFGDPEGFSRGCAEAIPPIPPRIRTMLPPRLNSNGRNVRGERREEVPSFLNHMSTIPRRPSWAGVFNERWHPLTDPRVEVFPQPVRAELVEALSLLAGTQGWEGKPFDKLRANGLWPGLARGRRAEALE